MKFVGCKFIVIVFLAILSLQVQAQTKIISGKILDKEAKTPLIYAYVSLVDSSNLSNTKTVVTDSEGNFSLENVKIEGRAYLKISILGYQTLFFQFDENTPPSAFETIYMEKDVKTLSDVDVVSTNVSAIQNGDTTEVNVSAFKTTPDATTEDLLKKLPGISVENGAVTSNGKEITRILLDGKEFYGEDPSVAIKNLPADLVDKIQVYDRVSEQAQFLGFDDGSSEKTLNIITKKEKKRGKFGKFYAGSDFDSKYLAGGNYNIFKKKFRLSFIGLANNVNQLNLSDQDMIGITSVTKEKNSGGFTMNKQNGLNTTYSIGANINKEWGKKVEIAASYFINFNDNSTEEISTKQKFLSPFPDHFTNTADSTYKEKLTQRANFRVEYNINTSNSLVNTSKLTIQNQNSNGNYKKKTTCETCVDVDKFVSELGLALRTEEDAFTVENELVFNHKFEKKKRTFSIEMTNAASNRTPVDMQVGYLKKSEFGKQKRANEYLDGNTNTYKNGINLVYTEPLGNGALHFNIKTAYTTNSRERMINDSLRNDFTLHVPQTAKDSIQSNIFKSYYLNNQAGVLYRLKNERIKLSFGARYQKAYLDANQIFPVSLKTRNEFENILPEFQITLKRPLSNLKFEYETSVNSPSISQLSNYIDNSDQTNISSGNPFLKQEYTHDVSFTYSYAKPRTSVNYTFFISGRYTRDYIGSQTIKPLSDSTVEGYEQVITSKTDFTRPLNFDHYKRLRSSFSIGLPANFIKSKINLSTSFNYSQTPRYINKNYITYDLYSSLNSFSIASSVSENIDFLLTYTISLNKIKNSQTSSGLSEENSQKPIFYEHIYSAKLNWIIWKGFKFIGDVSYLKDYGFYSYNPDYLLCNLSLAKIIFKNKAGEIKLSVFDAAQQNRNIVHAVSPQYILDAQVNTLTRYYMLTFTYNLSQMKN